MLTFIPALLKLITRGLWLPFLLPVAYLYVFLQYVPRQKVKANLVGKVVVVTGSNTGIGKEIARKAYQSGATVILACRSDAKAKEAIDDIQSNPSDSGRVEYAHLDLSDLSTVVNFVAELRTKHAHLDILVNNAGVNTSGTTKNNLEQLFQTNYLGHFLLVNLLLQDKNSREPLRVVNMSSLMHHLGNTKFKASIQPPGQNDKNLRVYMHSKFYLNLLTLQLNSCYSPVMQPLTVLPENIRPVVSVCADPGFVHSDIWRGWTGIFKTLLECVMKLVSISTDLGSETAFYGAVVEDKDIISQTKNYFSHPTRPDMEEACTGHPLIPYLVPYYLPSLLFLAVLGPYAFPNFTPSSVPLQVEKSAAALWDFSANLCVEKLAEDGIDVTLLTSSKFAN